MSTQVDMPRLATPLVSRGAGRRQSYRVLEPVIDEERKEILANLSLVESHEG